MSQIPITEDLTPFFEIGDFAQDVIIQGNTIPGIITDFYDTLEGGSVGIEGAEVLLIVMTSDVPIIYHGDGVDIDSELFIIVNVREDNTGVTRLQLARA